MKKGKREELAEEFLLGIGKIMRGTGAIFRSELEEYGVTWPQFHLLKVVRIRGKISITELSNRLMIAAPTTSRMIDGLCLKGLLEKERDEHDHRITLVTLTSKCERSIRGLMDTMNRKMVEVFEGEDEEALEKSVRQLSRVADKWSALTEPRVRNKEQI